MKNILLSFGKEEIVKDWMLFFDNYYYIKNKDRSIDHREIKSFFQDELVILDGDDNLFIINNDLNINGDSKNVLEHISNEILKKDKFCYLWNYMQECQKLKLAEKYEDFKFYYTNLASEIFAIAANFKTWYSILLNKDKETPLYLRLQDNTKDNVYFIWPSPFNLPLDKIDNNYLLTSLCKENFNAQPLKPYNNNVAKIFFILTISVVSVFFYFFWKKIPRPRYFYLKHTPQKF